MSKKKSPNKYFQFNIINVFRFVFVQTALKVELSSSVTNGGWCWVWFFLVSGLFPVYLTCKTCAHVEKKKPAARAAYDLQFSAVRNIQILNTGGTKQPLYAASMQNLLSCT